MSLQAEINYLQSHLTSTELTQPLLLPPPQAATAPAVFSLADLPSATAATMPVTYDMSTLFDPLGQPSLPMQQQRPNIDPRQYLAAHGPTSTTNAGQHGSSSVPSSDASSSLSLSKFSK